MFGDDDEDGDDDDEDDEGDEDEGRERRRKGEPGILPSRSTANFCGRVEHALFGACSQPTAFSTSFT